jgi:hypothetical protein
MIGKEKPTLDLVLFLPMDLILGDRSLIDALFRKEGSAIYTYVI